MSHLNVAGWTTGNSDLRTAFISLSNSDIFCVSETHLLRDTQLSVEGYRYFAHNRTGVLYMLMQIKDLVVSGYL